MSPFQASFSVKAVMISGFGFALIMAAFDYIDKAPFNLLKFVVNFLFFGVLLERLLRKKKK